MFGLHVVTSKQRDTIGILATLGGMLLDKDCDPAILARRVEVTRLVTSDADLDRAIAILETWVTE